MTKPAIGFIGVGLMGHGMARNMLEKGHALTVICHRNRAPVDDLVQRGAVEVQTPLALAARSDIVFTCLNASPDVEDVILRPDGVLAGARPGTIVADASTADPTSTLRLARILAEKGVIMCDTALGNSPVEAEAGTLNAFVGADPETFAKIRPVIETWAVNIVHVGDVGDGHRVKLVNNFIGMAYVALFAEAFTACQAIGLDPLKLHDVVKSGGLYCGMFERISRWVLERDPKAHLMRIKNSLKDLTYFNRMVEDVGMSSLLGHSAQHLFQIAKANGLGEAPMPRLVDAVTEMNGMTPRPSKSTD
jgi:3-hydroxyisobutyrate dehydrogenase-like beta-hydroxyacid dehydrogenase